MSTVAELRKLQKEVGDLVAKHAQQRDITDYAKYADDPAGFMRDVLRCTPWSKQVEMADSVRDHARVIVVTANGLGKDWVTARIALWWVYARRGFVILTGPTERQTREICMREVRRAFATAPELPGELYALSLRVDDAGECGILAFTSDNADKLTGFHHPRLLLAMTEGQGVDDDAYEAALACCTGPGNRLFVYGNPTRPTGSFYRVAHSETWHTLTIPASAHPNVVSGREEIPGCVSREWIRTMADEYGETSSIYRSRVLAQFPDDALEGLIRRDWMRAAFDRHTSGALSETAGWQSPLLAVDVARYGPDASALAVVRGPIVEEIITWRGASITDSADTVIRHAERLWTNRALHPPAIVVDEPGLGGGLIDVIRKRGWSVRAFNGGAHAFDQKRFLNLRAESHWTFRTLLENDQIALPLDEALLEEALSIEWQLTSSGLVQIVGKDILRKTLGRSPDRLDAVIIGLSQTVGKLRRFVTPFTVQL